jgi:cysteine-rich repeat protein
MVAIIQDYKIKCITCKIDEHYHINPINQICVCVHGFELIDRSCKEICGDGISIVSECDDGGRGNRDGCSHTCTAEDGFYCTKYNYTSYCRYYRYDIVLHLQKISKIPLENKAIFYFAFYPKLFMEKLL